MIRNLKIVLSRYRQGEAFEESHDLYKEILERTLKETGPGFVYKHTPIPKERTRGQPRKLKPCHEITRQTCHRRPDCRYNKQTRRCEQNSDEDTEEEAQHARSDEDTEEEEQHSDEARLIDELNSSHIASLNPKAHIAQTLMDIYLRYILAKQGNPQIYVLPTLGISGAGGLLRSHVLWLDQACTYPIALLPIVHDGHHSLLVLKQSQTHIVYYANSLKSALRGPYHVPEELMSYLVDRNHGTPIQWMNLDSPQQICNNCGIHVLQNCEMVYYHGEVEKVKLKTLLGAHGAGENVNHLRMCMQDLMCRLQDNWIELGGIRPFLRNTRKPVPKPGHKPVLLQDIIHNVIGKQDTIVIETTVHKEFNKKSNPNITTTKKVREKMQVHTVVDIVDGHKSEFQRMHAPGMATDIYILLILGRNWMDMEPGPVSYIDE